MNKFNELVARRGKQGSKLGDVIRRLSSDKDGEVVSTVHAMLRMLQSCNADIHVLVEHIETGGSNSNSASLNAAEMQRIYDAAYQKGFADGSEHGRKSAIVAGPSIGTFNAGVDSGVNGYSWQEIARHCAANKHLFHGRDYDFVESIAEQLEYKSKPSPAQAPWLKDLFMRKFNGRID
jgi:hypothetical protein